MSVKTRHTDFEQLEEDAEVAVHFYESPRTDAEGERRITGTIEAFYTDERALIDVDPDSEDRNWWVVDFGKGTDDGMVHLFDAGADLGHPVYVDEVESDDEQTDSDTDEPMNDSETEIRTDGGEDQNDITRAYQQMGELNELAGQWESELQELGQIAASVSGDGFSGTFERGWFDGEGSVELSTRFTIPMDIPAFYIEQMKAEFQALGATVNIDVSGSVAGRPPKVKDSGAVIPQGPSQERIDAMAESDKLHTGQVEVTLDVTNQMQGIPDGMIIEGSRVALASDIKSVGVDGAKHGDVTSIHGETVYVEFDGESAMDSVPEEELALIDQ